MTRGLGRAIATALLAALMGGAWAALFYAWHPGLLVEFDRDLPRNVSGVYPAERDQASRLTFAWTGQDVVVRLPALDRHVPWTLALRVRGGRAVAGDNPDLTILVDGIVQTMRHTSVEFDDVSVEIPPRPDRQGLIVGLRSSTTFVPGPADPRALGVMLDRLSLTPSGAVLAPRPALAAAAVSSAAMGAALALLGVTAGTAIGGAALVAAGTAAIVTRGFGPFTDYPWIVIRLGLWIALVLTALSFFFQDERELPLRNTARFAAAFSAAALFLKLLVLLHPDMPIGDALFHAHRFQGVLRGNLYFTSVAPGGYAFPYPPGLYVFASLFAGLVRRGAADMALLRIITCSVDAGAALLLYRLIAVAWNDRIAAAMAVALYHLMPLDFAVLTTGNLTNAFAQSVAVGAFVIMGSGRLRVGRWGVTAGLALVLAVAYLSHAGTFAILFVATMATALVFRLWGDRSLRSAAGAIVLVSATTWVLAVVLYYAHFMGTYRAEFARIGHETARAAADAGGRTIGGRLGGVPYSVGISFGTPVLLFAVLGGIDLMRRRADDALTLTLAGWLLSCVAFLVLGILTPVDMRYYLAAIPALAASAAFGAAWAWRGESPRQIHRRLWRASAAVFLAGTISTGIHNWWSALG